MANGLRVEAAHAPVLNRRDMPVNDILPSHKGALSHELRSHLESSQRDTDQFRQQSQGD
jgi:hypothetical protein